MKRGMMLIALILTGCVTMFSPIDPDTVGYLPAASDAPVRVAVNHSLDTHVYKPLVYVDVQMHGVVNWPEYQDYIMTAVKHLGFFDQVITRQPTVYINKQALEPTQRVNDQDWVDVSTPLPINSLLDEYGKHFLIMEVELNNRSSDPGDTATFSFEVKLIEPSSRRVLLVVSNQGFVRNGLDRTIINPVLNYTLAYLQFYDPTFDKGTPGPKTLNEWWENLKNDFVKAMFV